MGNPVVHFEIAGGDAERSRAFYGELFEWDIAREGMYALVDTRAETGIRGGLLQTPPDVPPYVTFYVSVDDLDKYLRRAGELGGRTIVGPMSIPGIGAFAMFADPDGNVVGLFKESS
jgi:predicted enzyme related to lactoylglutathione lyase